MKKVSLFLTIILLFSFSRADELDVVIAQLEKHKKDLQENYENYVFSMHDYYVSRHFSFTAFDHQATLIGLVQQSQQQQKEITLIEAEFRSLQIELANNPQKINELGVQLFALQSRLAAIQSQSRLRLEDGFLLEKSWNNYCYNQRLNSLNRFFDPLSLFTPDVMRLNIPNPQVPIQINAGATFGSNGEMLGYSGSIDGESAGLASGMGLTVGYAVSQSTVCGPAAPYCAAGIAALGILIDVFTISGDIGDIVEKKERIRDIQNEMYAIQLRALEKLHALSFQKVEANCQQHFVAGDLRLPDDLNKSVIKSNTLQNEINQFKDNDLQTLDQNHSSYLETVYFPELVKNYVEQFKEQFKDKKILRRKIEAFVDKNVSPLLLLLQDANFNLIQKTTLRQKLWDSQIVGDALFLENQGFIFYGDKDTNVNLSNIWLQISPFLVSKLAQ